MHELHTIDRATEWPRPRLIPGVRHGSTGIVDACVRHLYDQGASPSTHAATIAEPEAKPPSIAVTVTFAFGFTQPIRRAWHGRRNAVAHDIAGFGAEKR